MSDMKLYQLTDEYRQACEVLSDMDIPQEAIQDTLEGIQGEIKSKAIAIGYVVGNLESLASQIKEAINRMTDRAKALESRAEGIREYLKANMEASSISEITCPHFTMKIKKNPPKVEIFSAEMIPSEFMRQAPPPPPEPDKKAIKEAIDSGAEVPGARKVQGTRLEIK